MLQILGVLDLVLLVYLCLVDRQLLLVEQQSLEVEKANLSLYREYFNARLAWYQARANKKAPENPGAGELQ